MRLLNSGEFSEIRIGLGSWNFEDFMSFSFEWSVYNAFEQFKKLYRDEIDDGDEIVFFLSV